MIIYVVLILLLMLPGLKPCLQMGNKDYLSKENTDAIRVMVSPQQSKSAGMIMSAQCRAGAFCRLCLFMIARKLSF